MKKGFKALNTIISSFLKRFILLASVILSIYLFLPLLIIFFLNIKNIVIPIFAIISHKPTEILVAKDSKIEVNNDFSPKAEVNLKKWGDEAQLKVNYPITTKSKKTTEGELTKWEDSKSDVRFYKINSNERSGAENWNKFRYLDLGEISPNEAASLADYWHENNPGPMIETYRMDRNAYAFWGYRDVSVDLNNTNNLPAPVYRFKTSQKKTCPVILVTNRAFITDVYLPGLNKHPEYLDQVQKAIFDTFREDYEVDLFKTESGIMYRDGLKVKQLGRIDQEGDYVGFYFYLDSPLNTNLVNNLNLQTKTRDQVLYPIAGLREINQNIDFSFAERLSEGIALSFKSSLKSESLSKEEQDGISKFSEIQENIDWKMKGERIDDNFNKFQDDDQRYELDVVLKEKPANNVISFDIETKNLDFYYQPELTAEERARGDSRPENVIGSYAVYHKTKKGNYEKLGGQNYGTGKAFHIYRPLIIDANGNKIWGQLNVDTSRNLLTVTVDQNYLDNATYPVVVDPTFGYTTQGATNGGNIQLYNAAGSSFLGGEGNGISLSVFINSGKNKSTAKAAVYRDSDSSLVPNSIVDIPASANWMTTNFTSPPTFTSQDYIIMVCGQGYEQSGQTLAYDTGEPTQGHSGPIASWVFPDPGVFTHDSNKYSMYVTYGQSNNIPNVPAVLTQKTSPGSASIAEAAWTNDNTPDLGFTISDPDAADTVKYEIQVDSVDSTFTNLVLDYTHGSLSANNTPFTFTVGSYGDGSCTGTCPATLSDATTYFWRVRAIDNSGAQSSWSVFGELTTADYGVDATSPIGGIVKDGTGADQDWNNGALNTISGNWTGTEPTSTVSGLNKYEYAIRRQSDNYFWNPGGGWQGGEYWYNNNTATTFTVSPITLDTNTVYYVSLKTTDIAGNSSLINSNGQQVSPTLSFSFDTSQITFDNLNNANNWTNTKTTTFTAQTNAKNGYTVQGYTDKLLTSVNYISDTIANFIGTWALPAAWSGFCKDNATYCGFGYTSNDTSVQGSNRFSDATLFAAYSQSSPGNVLADNTGPTIDGSRNLVNELFTITHKVSVPITQAAAKYQASLYVIISPNF